MAEDRVIGGVLRDLKPAPRKSLADEVLDRLREEIVRGRFRPGYRLSESMLASAFGVSRGPVREALSQLQQEGLVKVERHRGARVNRISAEDVGELYELRIDLERFAVKRAVRLVTDGELARMEEVVSAYADAVERDAVQEAVDLDMEFHGLIYKAARHTRLYSCWTNLLRSQIHAFVLSNSLADSSYMAPCVSEHSKIRGALEARDRERAAELVDDHLRGAYERLVRTSFEGKQAGKMRR